MITLRGFPWGPVALPDFLRAQLAAHGFTADDAGRCARLINEHPGGAAAASLFVDLGSCKFLEADIDGAIAAWRHAIASHHDAAAARSMLNLGLLYEHLHLHDQALGMLARVAERDVEPYVVAAAMASARSQVVLGQPEMAMETMARLAQIVMARRPDGVDLVEALYGLGDVAEHAGRFDRAERAWRVAAASPTSPMQKQAATRLVQLLLSQGRSHAVDPSITGAEPDSRSNLAVLLDTAELFLRTGEKRAAAQLLATIDPSDFVAVDRFRFVDANLMAGRINEAIDELESLLGLDDGPIQNRALFSLGRVYASYDMIDPSISMFQRAVASDDSYWMPAASVALGDVLAARGDRGPANEYWSYAAGGSVPRLAEQAQERMATPEPAVPDSGAPTPTESVHPESMPTEPGLLDFESPDLDASDLDFLDLDMLDLEDLPAMTAAEPAEPQFILLDSIDTEPVAPTNSQATERDVELVAGKAHPDAAASAKPEPVLMVLADVERDAVNDSSLDVLIDLNDDSIHGEPETVARKSNGASVFTNYADDDAVSNPYAALAPDGQVTDVAPTTRNPYEELAPNFAGAEFEPPADVEPGDWESLLGDAPADKRPPTKRSSAFSRYT